ncbi:hypothetical protein PIB30_088626 [Stylosanthes scabra]|uniref:Uncharacterized protein n=1 Tax=Stylosanthes scabra TaxID=79078 RepID=A0ABU6XUX2_9FABA|nr:hypothetical protein [Stylosanthes scabra]
MKKPRLEKRDRPLVEILERKETANIRYYLFSNLHGDATTVSLPTPSTNPTSLFSTFDAAKALSFLLHYFPTNHHFATTSSSSIVAAMCHPSIRRNLPFPRTGHSGTNTKKNKKTKTTMNSDSKSASYSVLKTVIQRKLLLLRSCLSSFTMPPSP